MVSAFALNRGFYTMCNTPVKKTLSKTFDLLAQAFDSEEVRKLGLADIRVNLVSSWTFVHLFIILGHKQLIW